MKRPHADLMDDLAARHAPLAALIGDRPIHYVDVPMYANVGDLLIMLGTERFFERHRLRVAHRCTYFQFEPARVRPGEVVVFQGGGNLGDLYRHPQAERDAGIARLPGHRIIVLPQSIHFDDPAERERTAARWRRHPDLHLGVRDRDSQAQARSFTPHVHLLPDMAHQLWPLRPPPPPGGRHGTLHFLRTDGEATGAPGAPARGHAPAGPVTRADWPAFVGRRETLYRQITRTLRVLHALRLDGPLVAPALAAWRRHAEALLAEAAALFDRHEHLVTDRLHGHILACLLDRPHEVRDNRYGKNTRYLRDWTGASDRVALSPPDPADAPR